MRLIPLVHYGDWKLVVKGNLGLISSSEVNFEFNIYMDLELFLNISADLGGLGLGLPPHFWRFEFLAYLKHQHQGHHCHLKIPVLFQPKNIGVLLTSCKIS